MSLVGEKMLKYYGKIVLIRECDKGIVLITENQKTITFVEHDGEIYYLVCEIVNLISHDGLTFEDAFNKFEKQNGNLVSTEAFIELLE